MPRYFFSIRTDDNLAVDPEVYDLTNAEAAMREAELTLRELAAEVIVSGEGRIPDCVVVFDEQGNEVYRLNTEEIIRRRPTA